MIQQIVNCRLLDFFQNSEMNSLYEFVKSEQAKKIVQFIPAQNPKQFCFSLALVAQVWPSLNKSKNLLIRALRRQGLIASKIKSTYWRFSHPTLTLSSTKKQIMQAWYESSLESLLSSECMFVKIYKELEAGVSKFIKWNPEGTGIVLDRVWPELSSRMTGFGFETANKNNVRTLSHRYIRRGSPISHWLTAALEKIQYDRHSRKCYLMRRGKYLEGKEDPKGMQWPVPMTFTKPKPVELQIINTKLGQPDVPDVEIIPKPKNLTKSASKLAEIPQVKLKPIKSPSFKLKPPTPTTIILPSSPSPTLPKSPKRPTLPTKPIKPSSSSSSTLQSHHQQITNSLKHLKYQLVQLQIKHPQISFRTIFTNCYKIKKYPLLSNRPRIKKILIKETIREELKIKKELEKKLNSLKKSIAKYTVQRQGILEMARGERDKGWLAVEDEYELI